MLKVAILDDYQNVSHEFVDLKNLSGKYEFKIFSEPFFNEAEAIEQLAEFEALLMEIESISDINLDGRFVLASEAIDGLTFPDPENDKSSIIIDPYNPVYYISNKPAIAYISHNALCTLKCHINMWCIIHS